MISLYMLAAAVSGPGEVKVFRDWVAGCDNVLRCEAQALIPDAAAEGAVMIVTREAGPAAPVRLRFAVRGDGRPVAFAIDGKRATAPIVASGSVYELSAESAAAAVPLILKGKQLTLLGEGDSPVAIVSLAGATAALLHIDDQQGRVGGVTALARKGKRSAKTVPAAPAAPVIPRADRGGLASAPPAAEIDRIRKETGCTPEEVGGPVESDAFVVEDGKTLLLVACGTGAYNLSTIAYIGEGGRFAPARFDHRPGRGQSRQAMLVNASWDRGVLSSFSKGRGVGDCGSSESYVWDGAQFRLVEAKVMPECKGSIDWIRTWTAQVVRKAN